MRRRAQPGSPCATARSVQRRRCCLLLSNTRPLRSATLTLGGCMLGRPAWPSRRFTARYSNGLLRAAAPNNPGPHSREHVRICCSRPPGFHFDYKHFFRGELSQELLRISFFDIGRKRLRPFLSLKEATHASTIRSSQNVLRDVQEQVREQHPKIYAKGGEKRKKKHC